MTTIRCSYRDFLRGIRSKERSLNFIHGINFHQFLVQERLTNEVANGVLDAIQPAAVGVIMQATYVTDLLESYKLFQNYTVYVGICMFYTCGCVCRWMQP